MARSKELNLTLLRRYAVGRSFFLPTTLPGAIEKLGYVQADPIRAPARAQDLILRHRVKKYRAGDLDRRYHVLDVEEDVFVNYGFVTKALQRLMHPRSGPALSAAWRPLWPEDRRKQAHQVLEFVRRQGQVHPREVDSHFSHGKVTNWFGGSYNASTQLLESMHYDGFLRVVRREGGIRIYAVQEHGDAPVDVPGSLDALVDAAVNIYAPLPGPCLSFLLRRIRHGAPQWRAELTVAIQRAKTRLAHATVEGVEWYWPAGEDISGYAPGAKVRLMAPFDPVVWDRDRFELLWGWVYRFEAYTPPPKRVRGYYALPLLWRDRVIGWGNLSVVDGKLNADLGYVDKQPDDGIFRRELEAELDRFRQFLALSDS